MFPQPDDTWIDDELRNVAVPADLVTRLHAIAALGDGELDRALCDVAVPAGLFDRLRSIGTLDEVDLDDELAHVLVPISLAHRLRRIPAAVRRVGGRRSTLRVFAVAASLLMAVGVGYLIAISPSWFDATGRRPNQSNTVATARQPATRDIAVPDAKDGPSPPRDEDLAHVSPQTSKLPEFQYDPRAADRPDLASSKLTTISPPVTEAAGADNGNRRSATGALTAPVANSMAMASVPPLESMPPPVWKGIAPPRERGYDLMFQLKHGVHPVVSPASTPALAVCQVPLVTNTGSFDAACQLAADRKLPPAHRVRLEEFLAAMDYGFAMPDDASVAIRTALGPAPWGAPGSNLLQVAAQAGRLSNDGRAASHMIVILDASPSTQAESHWRLARRGLSQYIQRMQPADRLSLVLVADKASTAIDRQSRDEALQTLNSLGEPSSGAAANLVDAVSMAASAARRNSSEFKTSSPIVLLTDGLAQLDEAAQQQIEGLLVAATGAGHRFEVLDIRQEETIDEKLNRLATIAASKDPGNVAGSGAVGSGAVRHANTATDIRWSLLEIAAAKSQLVATQATMKVTFNPDAVAMYRLLGHETTSVAGLMSATVEANLRSGEAATGLFEVALNPGGGETVATVEITWRNPTTGAQQTTRQTVSRLQLSTSFYQAPLSLQMAALAAETAEILRGSPFAPPNTHSLGNVAEVAGQLNPRLRNRPSFAKLMTLVEQAQRSHVVAQ